MITEEEYDLRARKFRGLLSAVGLKGAVLTRREDVRYFSGFTGDDTFLVITPRKRILVTDRRYDEEAEKSCPGCEVNIWKKNQSLFCNELLVKMNIEKAGFSQEHLTVSQYTKLKKNLKLVPIDSLINSLRAEKSPAEVKIIQKALVCAQTAFNTVKPKVSSDMTEIDLKLELEWQMRKLGAEGVAFDTIVACAANSSLPHAHSKNMPLKPEKPIVIDFGAFIDGYNCDLTRTLFIGNIPKIWLSRYKAVLEAQYAGIEEIADGRPCADADNAARKVFESHDVLDYFSHSLGHGVGMEVHEAPRLSYRSREKLRSGNVVTIEPGLYFPGKGGIRIEDMALVGKSSATVLSNLDKDPFSAVV